MKQDTPTPVAASAAVGNSKYRPPAVVPTEDEEIITGQGAEPFVVRGGTAFPIDESWTMRAVHRFDETAPVGSVGKRHSSEDPLTEHDIAERVSRAAARLVGLLMEARQLGMQDLVGRSRYLVAGTFDMVQEEIDKWQ